MYYFDTSFFAPLLLREVSSPRIMAFVAALPKEELFLSQWTGVEFFSLVNRLVRTRELSRMEGQVTLERYQELIVKFSMLPLSTHDYALARHFLSDFSVNLRGGDSLHLAIARHHGASQLLTLDKGLFKAAGHLGIQAFILE